jgi:hydroxymethylpyrimidine/phosphomethylpyrimidine kinase
MQKLRPRTQKTPVALTIAGSDSSGGAGIQADLRAFAQTGVPGASVITCITAQNTMGVQHIEPVSTEMISKQIDSILTDIKPIAIKTGMLYSPDIVELVSTKLEVYKKTMTDKDNLIIVVDPVLVATTGSDLTDKEKLNNFIEALKTRLFPIATVITPNLHEAGQLLGWEVKTYDSMKKACEELLEYKSEYVLLKGGHRIIDDKKKDLNGLAVDLLYNGTFKTYKSSMFDKDVHGTGCFFASSIAGYLAKGMEMISAVDKAKKDVSLGIKNSVSIGDGIEVFNIKSGKHEQSEHHPIITELNNALVEILKILKPKHVPEVGINIGYALPNAQIQSEICALTGRIVRVGSSVGHLGDIKFGASKHVARIILAAMKHDKSIRSAMNIKYRPETIGLCKGLKFTIGTFNRVNEPEAVSSMEWGTRKTIENLGFVPDIIYDTGGLGKEPMIRILGKNPGEVFKKLKKILNHSV